MNRLRQLLPPPASPAGLVARLVAGVAIGFFLHFLLYRIALPLEPFVYVAF